MNPRKRNFSSLISCNESVEPSVGLSRDKLLLPFYAFMAHHRENFTFTSTTSTILLLLLQLQLQCAGLMAKNPHHLATENIHLNVNFMSQIEDIQEKGDV